MYVRVLVMLVFAQFKENNMMIIENLLPDGTNKQRRDHASRFA